MSAIGKPRLRVRTLPLEGESWVGYLRYLAQINRFTSLGPLAAIAGLRVYNLMHGDAYVVCGRLGLPVKRPIGPLPTALNTREGQIYKTGKASLKICVECIKDGLARVPAIWELNTELFCTNHTCILISKCPLCGNVLNRSRIDWKTCKCGCEFASLIPEKAPRWMRVLRALFSPSSKASRAVTFSAASKTAKSPEDRLDALQRLLRVADGAALFEGNWKRRLAFEARRGPMAGPRRRLFVAVGGLVAEELGRILLTAWGYTDNDFKCVKLCEVGGQTSWTTIAEHLIFTSYCPCHLAGARNPYSHWGTDYDLCPRLYRIGNFLLPR